MQVRLLYYLAPSVIFPISHDRKCKQKITYFRLEINCNQDSALKYPASFYMCRQIVLHAYFMKFIFKEIHNSYITLGGTDVNCEIKN